MYGAQAIHALGNLLTETSPAEERRASDPQEALRDLQAALSRIRFPGLAVVISDFLVPQAQIEQWFTILRSKNLDLTAIQVLGPSDFSPLGDTYQAVAVDSETGEEVPLTMEPHVRHQYETLLSSHNERLAEYCAQTGVHFARARSDEALSHFVVTSLSGLGLLRS